MSITENFEAIDEEVFTEFAGKCIAIVDGKVVVSGDSFKEIYEITKERYPGKRPLFGRLPERNYISYSF